MEKIHTITAHLRNNVRTPQSNDFVAVVEYEDIIGLREICESAASKQGSAVSAETLLKETELVLGEAFDHVLDGFEVDLGLFSARTRVWGAFYGENDIFDPKRHRVSVKFMPNKALLDGLESVGVVVTGRKENPCRIDWVENIRTGNIDGDLLPGDLIKLIGYGLLVGGRRDDVGVYFVEVGGGGQVKLEEIERVSNHSDELIIRVPDRVTWGYHKIKVVTQYNVETEEVEDELLEAVYVTPLKVSGKVKI